MGNYNTPLINPVNNDGRYFYETGRGGSFQEPISNISLPDWVGFEDRARIARQPVWLTFMHVQVPDMEDPLYVLLFDVNPTALNIDAMVASGMPARYSLGPILPTGFGGTIIYEAVAEEVPCRVDPRMHPHGPPSVHGLPFGFGILAFASITPRVFTGPAIEQTLQMAITARMQG